MTSIDGDGIIRTRGRDREVKEGGGAEWRCHGQVTCGQVPGRAIAREWRRPGLSLQRKRTPNKEIKNQKTPRESATTMRNGSMYKVQGDKEHDTNTLGPA